MTAVETFALTRQFGGRGGCREVSLAVPRGCVFGLLGPNGAGKSTLVKTLMGLLHPTAGTAMILGRPLGDLEIRKRIGFLPEHFRFHEWMTGEDLLSFHAALYRLDRAQTKRRIPQVLELVGLAGHGRQRIGAYSKGMQQRIGLAGALLPDPDLLFLDEPTSALDPLGRREVREIILRLKEAGKTVFLNSHLLSEVELVCDELAMINLGTIVIQGRLDELLAPAVQIKARIGNLSRPLVAALEALSRQMEVNGDRVELLLDDPEQAPAAARAIVEGGGLLYELAPGRQSLEDLFVDLLLTPGGGDR